MTSPHANIPGIDRLLRDPAAMTLMSQYGRLAVVDALREAVTTVRQDLLTKGSVETDSRLRIINLADASLAQAHAPSLVAVFNLTGTVLHTNLGRAVLPAEAIAAIANVAAEPSNLEYDRVSGKRGDRDSHLERWLVRLTGAEAATVVNNNAAAVMLVLNTFAKRREVLVSRGELVEIGGSFRIPDVMQAAGAVLREVGTTNRVHLRDYADNVTTRTALIMKVHPSNYRIEGFTAGVQETALAALAKEKAIPFVIDLGSGTLIEFGSLGLPPEPSVQATLASGADLITFSGDKLLGGPQAGIIVGRRELIERLKKNAMIRALRVDKLTIAALEAVLRLYADPTRARTRIPTLRLLTRPLADISALAQALLPAVRTALHAIAQVETIACLSQIGSGALPVDVLPSMGLALRPVANVVRGDAAADLSLRLRELPRPVIGRIHQGAIILDLRCLEDPAAFLEQLRFIRAPSAISA